MPEPGLPLELSPLLEDDPPTIGPFQIVGRLGAGGMGSVYGALDGSGRCIAVKVIHPRYVDRPDYREHFARESALLRGLDAECVPAFLGADAEAEAPWLATEFVPGLTLSEHVREHGPLDGGELLLFAAGTAEAIAAIHHRGVMHRDIKPGNVILSPTGPKVVDFGIARGVDEHDREEQISGTPGYLAPERLEGLPSTPSGDVFAWGAMVAFAATGRSPYGAGATDEILARLRSGAHDLEGVPEQLRGLVERALARRPQDRLPAGECYSRVLDLLVEGTGAQPPAAAPAPLAEMGAEAPWDARRMDLRRALGEGWRRFDAAGHDPRAWAAAAGLGAGVGVAGAGGGIAAGAPAAAGTVGGSAAPGMGGGVSTGAFASGAASTGAAAAAVTTTIVVSADEPPAAQSQQQETEDSAPPYEAEEVEFRGLTLRVPEDWGVYRVQGRFGGVDPTQGTEEEWVVLEPSAACGEDTEWSWGLGNADCPHIKVLGPAGLEYGGPSLRPYSPDDIYAPSLEPTTCPEGAATEEGVATEGGEARVAEDVPVGGTQAALREFAVGCVEMLDTTMLSHLQRAWLLESEEILIVDNWTHEEFPEVLEYAEV